MICRIALGLTLLLMLSPFQIALAGQVTLSWVAPTANEDESPITDLAGYHIHYGTAPRAYSHTIPIYSAAATTHTITGLTEGFTYYFAVTALDTSGNESAFSNEVSRTLQSAAECTLTVQKSGTGTGTVTGTGINCGSDCTGPFNRGTVVTLTATPSSGSTFSTWSGSGCGSSPTCSTTLNASTTLTVTFELNENYTITASAGPGGSVSPAGRVKVPVGGSQTLTVTPLQGYKIKDVLVNGLSSGPAATVTLHNVSGNQTVSASFEPVTPQASAPDIAVTPSLLNKGFGPVNIGSAASQGFTITNSGAADLRVTSIAVPGGEASMFSVAPGGPAPCASLSPVIPQGRSCTVIVKFRPSVNGMKSAGLRITSNAVSAAVLDVPLSGTGTVQPVFSDVQEGSFAENFINTIFYHGITSAGCGDSGFCPDDPVTRAQMAVFMLTSMGEQPTSACTGAFGDVNANTVGDISCRFIEKFASLGITGGCGNDNFCPDDLVTRAQTAVFLTLGFLK